MTNHFSILIASALLGLGAQPLVLAGKPNLVVIMADGVLITHARCLSADCLPSQYSVLTDDFSYRDWSEGPRTPMKLCRRIERMVAARAPRQANEPKSHGS